MKKSFLIIFLVIFLLLPLISRADGLYQIIHYEDQNGNGKFDQGEPADPPEKVCYQGLVPCGKEVFIKGELEKGKCKEGVGTPTLVPCKFCHFPMMLLGVINFLILPPTGIVFLIAVLLLVVGGVMFIFSAGRPALASKGRSILTATLIGLVIIYVGWLLVNTFFMAIGVSEFSIKTLGIGPGKWAETMFNCKIYLPK